MEIRIGIQSVPRELTVETSASIEDVERDLAAALADGTLFSLTLDKGGKVLIPADKIAYLEFLGPGPRHVGFGSL